jgi:hypothetical protein
VLQSTAAAAALRYYCIVLLLLLLPYSTLFTNTQTHASMPFFSPNNSTSAEQGAGGVPQESLQNQLMGMSLLSSYSKPDLSERKNTCSTVDSSRASPPGSPFTREMSNQDNVSRPAGSLMGQLSPPFVKRSNTPNTSKNTSATSASVLTLTPNSSLDGTASDWLGARAGSLPYPDVPSLPFYQPEQQHRSNADTDEADDQDAFGSFGHADNSGGRGGLLEALRVRANSLGGPVPQPARAHFSAHAAAVAAGNDGSDRPRSVPRDRPPLSQSSYQEVGSSNHSSSNNNIGNMGHVASASSNRSIGSDTANSVNSDSYLLFGAIARPELKVSAGDFDVHNRRRAASSGDDYLNPYALDPTTMSNKFGTLPTLGSHIQQHRMPQQQQQQGLERPRHIRSVSQPVNGQVPAGADARFFHASMQQQEGHSYPGDNTFKSYSNHTMNSQSYPALASYAEAPQYGHKRYSSPNLAHVHNYGVQPPPPHGYAMHRRDMLDYQVSPQHSQEGSFMASQEEMRTYGAPSMISPGQSPVQVFYPSGVSRQSSDGGGIAMLSSSPMSLGGGAPPRRSVQQHRGYYHHHVPGGDEDLTHPLVGEHIDVPDGHDDFLSGSYPSSHMLPRNPSRGHSIGEMPPQYIEAHHHHHLPTAGAALTMPKVIHCIKFKRTQRNFVLGPRINRDLKVGTYVKVEADRGEDLGIVIGKIPADKNNFSGPRSLSAGLGPSPGGGAAPLDLKRIIRLATHDEVSMLILKRDEEQELLEICRAKVRQRELPMNVVDAEYQFDRHKLTFFFEAEGRVDFRELVRDLFSMYKTRIWMQQIDKTTSMSAQAFIAPKPSSIQMDCGTPIIAPVSEFADSIIMSGPTIGDATRSSHDNYFHE